MEPLADLIGESPGIVALREQVRRLLSRPPDARRLPPILLHGETGTGKGLLARAIHQAGPRAAGPYVDVNCAAIPETLLEAELFGYERGAFTDARQAKPGLFQTAHRGTLFLDEIGLLPEGLQGKLLKVIEERTVRRLGSTRSEPVDVWIVAATSQDLRAAVRAGGFREDLYHRLAVLTLDLPPLRERGADVLLLARHFLARACADYDLPARPLLPDAAAALLAYPWPGNVRELANVMERVVLLSDADVVTAATLALPAVPLAGPREAARSRTAASLDTAVRAHVAEVLRETDWNISLAAARLGVARNTLRARIARYGLSPEASRPPARRRGPPPAAARTPPTPAPAVRWERRRVTLVRADLGAGPPAEILLETSPALERLVEKLVAFGGHVEELGSAGLLAAFGLEPSEDAPRRAALAALAARTALARVGRGGAAPMSVRVAIDTAPLLVARTGGAPAIDRDARRRAGVALDALLERAGAGEVVVGRAVVPFLERRFTLTSLGDGAFRVGGREGPGARTARFVGRSQELELLRTRLGAAVRGQGQLVGIVGEAGIGKSRLLHEFRDRLRGEPVTYLEGRCHAYASATPYVPVLEMVRANCRLADTDAGPMVIEKVRRSLERVGMDADGAAPYLLQLLGVRTEALAALSPEAIQARTFEVLRRLTVQGSRRRPLVLAVDDLHWVDRTSETYAAGLVESLAGAPILLVATYRPGYRPPWIDRSNATQVALQPLAPEESWSLVHSVVDPARLPDAVARIILARADGNPLFLEELARAVGEQGGDAPARGVPETIEAVVLARIDRLPEETRRLVRTAAILGREVSRPLLDALWQPPESLAAGLRELCRLEFLYEAVDAAEPRYVFKHPLVREVAYESLPPEERRALHAAAGAALEALHAERPEAVYDRLAYHYARSEHAEKAVRYLTRVAASAARNSAHAEAVVALRDALAHAERVPAEARDRVRLDVALRQAQSLLSLGRNAQSRELLIMHGDAVARVADARLGGPYHFWLGLTLSLLGDQAEATESARRALESGQRAGDPVTTGMAYALLALEEYWAGHPAAGIEHGRRAVALLERKGPGYWLGMTWFYVAINGALMGDVALALDAAAHARTVGETIGHPGIQSYAAWIAAIVHAYAGADAAAREAGQRGLDLSPDPFNTALARGFLGHVYLEQGDAARARPLLEDAVASMSRFGERQHHGWFITFLGEAHLLAGDLPRARELAGEGLRLATDARFWNGVAWAHRTLGRIAHAAGRLPEAEAELGEARRLFAAIAARFELARTDVDLAGVAHARGDAGAASRHLADAHAGFAALGNAHHGARVAERAAALELPLPPSPHASAPP